MDDIGWVKEILQRIDNRQLQLTTDFQKVTDRFEKRLDGHDGEINRIRGGWKALKILCGVIAGGGGLALLTLRLFG